MNVKSFFDGLRQAQAVNAETMGDVKVEYAASARLIATAEYELEALRRDLRSAGSAVGGRRTVLRG